MRTTLAHNDARLPQSDSRQVAAQARDDAPAVPPWRQQGSLRGYSHEHHEQQVDSHADDGLVRDERIDITTVFHLFATSYLRCHLPVTEM